MNRIKIGIYLIALFGLIVFLTNYVIPSYALDGVNNTQIPKNVSLDLEENNLFPFTDFSLTTSTMETKNSTWLPTIGDSISVRPGGDYIVISHMELNQYAMQSHIVISGFNKTSESWTQIVQCPRGIDGPLKLTEFVCEIGIKSGITKIHPVFQSGWSSTEGQKAVTKFGNFFVIESPSDKTPTVRQ